MNSKEINNKVLGSIGKVSPTTKNSFPKVKMDGFYDTVKNTNMIEVVEQIKKEKVSKS